MSGWTQAFIYFFVVVVLHGVFCRVSRGPNAVIKFFIIGGIAGLALLRAGAAAVLSYAFLCECHLFFFTFVRSSVSVSLLLMLGQKPMSASEIDDFYSHASMVQDRVRKLLNEGFLRGAEPNYALTLKGKLLVLLFRCFQAFFRHVS